MRRLALLALLVGCSSAPTPTDAPGGSPCPTDPPTTPTACDTTATCYWDRCPTDHVHTGTCVDGTWVISEGACVPFDCGGSTCEPGQICVTRAGGALLTECVANPCHDSPIIADCACDACGDLPCTLDGRGVICNTCPSGLCP